MNVASVGKTRWNSTKKRSLLLLQKTLNCHVATLLAMTVLFLDILVGKERFALERRKAVENEGFMSLGEERQRRRITPR